MKRKLTKVFSWLCMVSLVVGLTAPVLMITPSVSAVSLGKATIRGEVRGNETGDPAEVSRYPLNQSVLVRLINGDAEVAQTRTYEDGRFFFHDVTDGTYTVKFDTVPGYTIVTPATSEETITIDSSSDHYDVDAFYFDLPNYDVVQAGDGFVGNVSVPSSGLEIVTYELVTPSTKGEIIPVVDGGYNLPMFLYVADPDSTGEDSITVKATRRNFSNNELISTEDIVRTIGIIPSFTYPVNEPPTIINETKETMINTPVSGGPVAVDLEMDWLDFYFAINPSHGKVEWDQDEHGIWTYTPNVNYIGTDTFTVEFRTGEGSEPLSSTITIIVKPIPTPPPVWTPAPVPTPVSTPTPPPVVEPPKLEYVRHFDYIFGYPDGMVKPENNISREEVATIFYRLMEDNSRKDYISNTHVFSDVMSDRWSNKIIATMNKAKVINGYSDGTFEPGQPITRAEFATIASRFDKLDERTNDFLTDISGHWAEKYITSAANKGWIKGYADNTFKPDQYITRAEAVTLINSVLDRHVQDKDIHKDARQWPDNKPEHWYYRDMLEATNYHEYSKEEEETEIWLKILPHRLFP